MSTASPTSNMRTIIECITRLAAGPLRGQDILTRSRGEKGKYPVFHCCVDLIRQELASQGCSPSSWTVEAATLVGLLGPRAGSSVASLAAESPSKAPLVSVCAVDERGDHRSFVRHVIALSGLLKTHLSGKGPHTAGAPDLGLAYALGWRGSRRPGEAAASQTPWPNAVTAVALSMVRRPYGPVAHVHRVLCDWVRGYREVVDCGELIHDACELLMTLARPEGVPIEASGPAALQIVPCGEGAEVLIGGPDSPTRQTILQSGEKLVFTAHSAFEFHVDPTRRRSDLAIKVDDRLVISVRDRQVVVSAEAAEDHRDGPRVRSRRIRDAHRVVADGPLVVQRWHCGCGHHACADKHRIAAYDPRYSLWSFLSNAVRGPVTGPDQGLAIQQGTFITSMYYPLLASRVGVVQRLVAVRCCSKRGCGGTGTDRCDVCGSELDSQADVTTKRLLVLRNDRYLDAFGLRSYWACTSCDHHVEMEEHVRCRNCRRSLFDIPALVEAEMWPVLERLLPRRAVSDLRHPGTTGLEALGPDVPSIAKLRAALKSVNRCPHCGVPRPNLEICPHCQGGLSRRATQLWSYDRERHVRSAEPSGWGGRASETLSGSVQGEQTCRAYRDPTVSQSCDPPE